MVKHILYMVGICGVVRFSRRASYTVQLGLIPGLFITPIAAQMKCCKRMSIALREPPQTHEIPKLLREEM